MITLEKTARAIIDVLDAEGKISGHEIEYHVVAAGEGAELIPPRVVREPATSEAVAVMRGQADATLTSAFSALNIQLADEREAAAVAAAEKQAALDAAAAAIAEKQALLGAAPQ